MAPTGQGGATNNADCARSLPPPSFLPPHFCCPPFSPSHTHIHTPSLYVFSISSSSQVISRTAPSRHSTRGCMAWACPRAGSATAT